VLNVGMPTSTLTRDLLMTAGWVINIVVVEWILAKRDWRGKAQAAHAGALAHLVKI
jgi:hypothetical protein